MIGWLSWLVIGAMVGWLVALLMSRRWQHQSALFIAAGLLFTILTSVLVTELVLLRVPAGSLLMIGLGATSFAVWRQTFVPRQSSPTARVRSLVLPASTLRNLIAAGRTHLAFRTTPSIDNTHAAVRLTRRIRPILDTTTYRAFFVLPATVLAAYQRLLKLIGKNLEAAFPDGTWQFYVEYGLREDSARHACETTGFHTAVQDEGLNLNEPDELAAWAAAAIWLLHHYDSLLANEWHEHTRLKYLAERLSDDQVITRWLRAKPYRVPPVQDEDFIAYRRAAFNAFCSAELSRVNRYRCERIEQTWHNRQAVDRRSDALAAYQRQMSILATLAPTDHADVRVPIPPDQLRLAVIHNGHYYLIKIGQSPSLARLRAVCAAILADDPAVPPAALDEVLCVARRADQPALRRLLPDDARAELERLRAAPIILNWDQADSSGKLADIRKGKRGIGDHAMTVFRGTTSTVFDLSHIFFDGPWGMAAAEIFTSQAIRFARQLSGLPPVHTHARVASLKLLTPPELTTVRAVPLLAEVSAETTLARLDLIRQARGELRTYHRKLNLTVNDILILHRTMFGQMYRPSAELTRALVRLAASPDLATRQASIMTLNTLHESRHTNPALLIPMDASGINPRERIFPTTFRTPFHHLVTYHQKALEHLDAATILNRKRAYLRFHRARHVYVAKLHAFGQLMNAYKEVALRGESISTATIKLLAGLPRRVQRLLDGLPNYIDVLNEVIKGQEVFSNVGQVAATSSLTRFNTAKDDNEKKTLAWGVITDAEGNLHLSLRDARPHVGALINCGQQALAEQITQEYLDAYALSLNTFVEELARIAQPPLPFRNQLRRVRSIYQRVRQSANHTGKRTEVPVNAVAVDPVELPD
ncbi:MAG: hypothetical protein IT324_00325 [Anaerolineae bacterium]|nr:hypothetical protein [Anaerolineae bacterium]